MNTHCQVHHYEPKDMRLEDAPDLTYLEALEGFEDAITSGDIFFKDNEEIFFIGGIGNDTYPDGYNDFFDEEGLKDLRCRVLQPGDSFTITIEN